MLLLVESMHLYLTDAFIFGIIIECLMTLFIFLGTSTKSKVCNRMSSCLVFRDIFPLNCHVLLWRYHILSLHPLLVACLRDQRALGNFKIIHLLLRLCNYLGNGCLLDLEEVILLNHVLLWSRLWWLGFGLFRLDETMDSQEVVKLNQKVLCKHLDSTTELLLVFSTLL